MGALKSSTISKKGQTTIPQEIRERLNLKDGDLLFFEVKNDGEVLLKKAPSIEDMDYLKFIERSLAPEWSGDDDDDL